MDIEKNGDIPVNLGRQEKWTFQKMETKLITFNAIRK